MSHAGPERLCQDADGFRVPAGTRPHTKRASVPADSRKRENPASSNVRARFIHRKRSKKGAIAMTKEPEVGVSTRSNPAFQASRALPLFSPVRHQVVAGHVTQQLALVVPKSGRGSRCTLPSRLFRVRGRETSPFRWKNETGRAAERNRERERARHVGSARVSPGTARDRQQERSHRKWDLSQAATPL